MTPLRQSCEKSNVTRDTYTNRNRHAMATVVSQQYPQACWKDLAINMAIVRPPLQYLAIFENFVTYLFSCFQIPITSFLFSEIIFMDFPNPALTKNLLINSMLDFDVPPSECRKQSHMHRSGVVVEEPGSGLCIRWVVVHLVWLIGCVGQFNKWSAQIAQLINNHQGLL